jgi:hypothetical protein
MDQTPIDRSADSEFTFDPTNKVVGIIDDLLNTKAALEDLRTAGFMADEVELLTDDDGARRIDISGDRLVTVHIFRSTQKLPAYYDAPGLLKRLEQELLAGHFFVAVASKDGEARERVHEVLKSHSGHFINFYGRWAAQALEP